MESDRSMRVLSVQSHVVSGYVGNKSSCFPLQLLGFEVDSINSVQLCNHTGYKTVKGQVSQSNELQELYDGLKANNLLAFSHVLTGYVGRHTYLTTLVEIIKDMKKINPNLYVVCDPVMGDRGKMYVPPEVLPIYRDSLLPLSDIITPNQYEAELLTGITINSEAEALKAMKTCHDMGVKTVVLSSLELPDSENLLLFGSSVLSEQSVVCMEIPKFDDDFTGTGDLFSALLLAWMTKTDGNLKVSCENTVNTIQCVLKRTNDYASKTDDPTNPASKELKLIQSKKDIECPPSHLRCR